MGVDVSAGLKIMVMIMSFWCDSLTLYHVTVINNTVCTTETLIRLLL